MACSDAGGGAVSCWCFPGFEAAPGGAAGCVDINECLTLEDLGCHHLADCDNKDGTYECVCPSGFLGDGSDCSNDAWGIRTVFNIPGVGSYSAAAIEALKFGYVMVVTQDSNLMYNDSSVETAQSFAGSAHFGASLLGSAADVSDAGNEITIFVLFETKEAAENASAALVTPSWTAVDASATIVTEPTVYRWNGKSTSDPLEIPPTGLSVDSVVFDTSCLENGCWVIGVTYTAGVDDINVFFLPKAEASDALSYDFDYTGTDSTWPKSAADTFLPKNHPCTTADYDPSSGTLPASITACCIPEFLDMYRPVAAFEAALVATGMSLTNTVCSSPGVPTRAITRSTLPAFVRADQTADMSSTFPKPSAPVAVGNRDSVFVQGLFKGMDLSHINHTEVVDEYVGIYRAVLFLDEVELRTRAGQLKGSPGIEHTVDTFVGLANFGITGSHVLDTFSTQTAIHLEKTSFFTVSTHGTNDYTFLEYVNMRLVAIYNEDPDFSSSSESGDRTVRTPSDGQANYVQVTFTLGSQYAVDPAGSPLIPLDSVRAGHGTFFDGADLVHMCSDWAGSSFSAQPVFNTTLTQQCGPTADMCVSPASIPDSFVVFNIPLGVDYLDEQAGGPSATLDHNIFVDMVISATEADPPGDAAPNAGGEPMQMKTTLTASIPIVEGGVNIFCDGFTAKTDLKDVANADIVVGSASTAEELTRLRIMKDIATTQLDPEAITQIDSDSIEAGLMTLVLKGNSTYFAGTNTGRDEVTIELEDVITIHIMDDDGAGSGNGKDAYVAGLLAQGPDDNSDSTGLDTDGYGLNGAFEFTIDRASQRAHLEPKSDLTDECPFNPPRPAGGMSLETCVTRRDVRYRGFPARTGGHSTAMELCTDGSATDAGAANCPAADATDSPEAAFFSTVLGNNEYALKLGSNYARVIAARYNLNNRYRRAYFINPGYEWTPTQTGGTPLFSVSQKLYLFALITLDEGLTTNNGADAPDLVLPSVRRRMLLQSTPSNVDEALQDGESSIGGGVFEFQTTPSQMMAKAFDVPQDRVATFKVKLQLTQAEACMSDTELQASIRETMANDYLTDTSTPFHTVQITRMTVDRAGVQCSRRSIRSLLSQFTEATVEATMLVVFEEGGNSVIALEDLATKAGVLSVTPLSVSPKVATTKPSPEWVFPDPDEKPTSSSSSSSNVAIIAGAAAGGALLLLAAIAGVVFMRRRNDGEVVAAVQTINVDDLKSQLAEA